MNKSNQLEPMLNAFLSDLAVLNIKVHNLHWNVECSAKCRWEPWQNI